MTTALNILILIFVLFTTLLLFTGERYYVEGFKLKKFTFKSKISKIFKKARKIQKGALKKLKKTTRFKTKKTKKSKKSKKPKKPKKTKKPNDANALSGDFSAAKLNKQFDLKTQDPDGVGKTIDATEKNVVKKQKSGVKQIDTHSKKKTINENADGKYKESMGNNVPNPVDSAGKVAKQAWKTTSKFASKSWKTTSKFAGKTWKDGTKAVGKGFKDGTKAVGKGFKDGAKAVGKFFCFSGDTPVILADGSAVLLKHVKLGDTLINGSSVDATMNIKASREDPFYRIYSEQLNRHIYVTGSHLIKDGYDRYVLVRDFYKSEKLDFVDDVLYCLITDTHTIPVGEFTFWDWETDILVTA